MYDATGYNADVSADCKRRRKGWRGLMNGAPLFGLSVCYWDSSKAQCAPGSRAFLTPTNRVVDKMPIAFPAEALVCSPPSRFSVLCYTEPICRACLVDYVPTVSQ
jgi:hypothetical protein